MLGRAPASLHWGKDCSVRLLFFFELLSPVLKRLLKTASCCVIPCAACGKISTTIKCKTCKISNISYTGRWYCVSCLYIYMCVCVWCVIIYIYCFTLGQLYWLYWYIYMLSPDVFCIYMAASRTPWCICIACLCLLMANPEHSKV